MGSIAINNLKYEHNVFFKRTALKNFLNSTVSQWYFPMFKDWKKKLETAIKNQQQ